MVKAQEWIDSTYPKEKREKITELDISEENLEGELDLSDFISLEKLCCYKNKLTSLNVNKCSQLEKIRCGDNSLVNIILPETGLFIPGAWPQGLKELDLSDNNFPAQDLSFLSSYTNLRTS